MDFTEAAALFDAQGFVLIKSMFDAEEAAKMSAMVDAYLVSNVPNRTAETVFYDDVDVKSSLK